MLIELDEQILGRKSPGYKTLAPFVAHNRRETRFSPSLVERITHLEHAVSAFKGGWVL